MNCRRIAGLCAILLLSAMRSQAAGLEQDEYRIEDGGFVRSLVVAQDEIYVQRGSRYTVQTVAARGTAEATRLQAEDVVRSTGPGRLRS